MQFSLPRQEYSDRARPALIQLNRHLVGLFRRDTTGKVVTLGSGFLVELAGERYVATAGHNLDEDPLGVTIWWFRPDSLGESLEGPELLAACGPEPRISYRVEEKGVDLGLIQLTNPERLVRAGKSFYQVDALREKREIPQDTLFFMLGFPARYVETIQVDRTPGGVYLPGPAAMQRMQSVAIPCFGGLTQAQEDWFEIRAECLDPGPDNDHEQSLHYGGYSGGPIFRLISAQGLEGDPAGFELFGLEFAQRLFTHHALLKCHYIRRWCSFAESPPVQISKGT